MACTAAARLLRCATTAVRAMVSVPPRLGTSASPLASWRDGAGPGRPHCLPRTTLGLGEATPQSGIAPLRPRSGRAAGDAAEHGAVGEAGAAWIIEKEDPPHHLACRVEAGDWMSIRVDNASGRIDLDATEGEGEPTGNGIGLEGR